MKLIQLSRLWAGLVLAFSLPHPATAGVGSSGGGTVVYLKSGKPVVTDLLTRDELEDGLMPIEKAKSKYASLHKRFVKRVANYYSEDPRVSLLNVGIRDQFIACASSTLSKVLPENLKTAIRGLEKPSTFVFNTALPRAGDHGYFGLPPIEDVSTTVSAELQFPVARYFGNDVDIDGPLFDQLSPESQCALGVHEWLRVAVFFGNLHQGLSPEEIEEYTRYALRLDTRNEAVLLSAKNKLIDFEVTHHLADKLTEVEASLQTLINTVFTRSEADSSVRKSLALLNEVKLTLASQKLIVQKTGSYDSSVKASLKQAREILNSVQLDWDDRRSQQTIVQSLDPWALSQDLNPGTLNNEWFQSHRDHEVVFSNVKHTFYFYAAKNFPAFMWFDTLQNKMVKRAVP